MRRRVLLVTPFAPASCGRHGGARAVHGLAAELVRRHDVVLLHLDRHEIDPEVAAGAVAVHAVPLSDVGRWRARTLSASLVVRGRSRWGVSTSAVPRVQRRVREISESFRPAVVQVEFGVLGNALAGASGALRVLTIHDPAASLREGLPVRHGALPLVHRLDARLALREERRSLRLADAVVVFSDRDRHLLRPSIPPSSDVVTIPMGWDVPDKALDPLGRKPPTLLFIGNFIHPPNVDAALRLVREILPLVRAGHPDVRVELVGAEPPPELVAEAGAAVSVTGEVPSVTPHLDRAAVFVAPVAIGGGVRVKVLEALAAGKAVVASPRAVAGVSACAGRDLVLADGAADTAAALSRLLSDDEARRRLAEGARDWALRELSWAAMADRYDELYARLQARHAAAGGAGRRP